MTFQEEYEKLKKEEYRFVPFMEKYEVLVKKYDKWWGKRTKYTSGWKFFHNHEGHLWEVFWHHEPQYAVWVRGWLVLMIGMFSGKIRGFQIWWPPVIRWIKIF